MRNKRNQQMICTYFTVQTILRRILCAQIHINWKWSEHEWKERREKKNKKNKTINEQKLSDGFGGTTNESQYGLAVKSIFYHFILCDPLNETGVYFSVQFHFIVPFNLYTNTLIHIHLDLAFSLFCLPAIPFQIHYGWFVFSLIGFVFFLFLQFYECIFL